MQKRFLITIAAIFAFTLIGKSQKAKTFDVSFKAVFTDSIQYSGDKSFRCEEGLYNELCVFKDNIEVPLPFVKTKKGKKIKYRGLKKGNYVLRYENIFAQIIEKPFTISNKSIRNMPIRLDKFIDTVKMSFFEEMKNGDSLSIFFYARYHEGYSCDSIIILKNRDEFIAKLFRFSEEWWKTTVDEKGVSIDRFITSDEQERFFVKEKILSSNDIRLMKNLFKKLTMLCRTWEHFCSGMVEKTYYIKINDKLIHKLFNDHCDWDSFNLLKNKIFDIKVKSYKFKF